MFKGGLTLEGVTVPAGLTLLSSSSRLVAFRFEVDRRFCNDNLRGLLSAGMLDMRNGIDGGTAAGLLYDRYV